MHHIQYQLTIACFIIGETASAGLPDDSAGWPELQEESNQQWRVNVKKKKKEEEEAEERKKERKKEKKKERKKGIGLCC